VEAHGLVGRCEEGEEGENDTAVPGSADVPRILLALRDIGPGAGRCEDTCKEGGLRPVTMDLSHSMRELYLPQRPRSLVRPICCPSIAQ
jgi:hypothetical protein